MRGGLLAQNCLHQKFYFTTIVGIRTNGPTVRSRRSACLVRAEGGGSEVKTKKTAANKGINPLNAYRAPTKEDTNLRAEAEAPFRSVRLVLFGFGAVSAALATFLSLPTVLGVVLGAPNATKSLTEAGTDFAINVGALFVCGYLTSRDLKARDKQLARLLREDALAACQVELSTGKILRLGQFRGAARPVIIAGTPAQVAAGIASAEPYRQALIERGVLVVGVPIYTDSSISSEEAAEAAARSELPSLKQDDLRWRAVSIRLNDWRTWFDDQATAASKGTEKGLFVGLRKDGRVRASGLGCPPWAQFVAQLPPEDGMWSGFLDGMDGRV